MTLYTIGHSNRTLPVFIGLLQSHGIELVVDIRRLPGSNRYPQFNADELATALREVQIQYLHLPLLGGRRNKAAGPSSNGAWENASFRNYADYMQTEQFDQGISELLELATHTVTSVMCSEAVWWRCHRRLVADALTVRGIEVRHIMGTSLAPIHSVTPFAKVDGSQVTYPASEGS